MNLFASSSDSTALFQTTEKKKLKKQSQKKGSNNANKKSDRCARKTAEVNRSIMEFQAPNRKPFGRNR
jgi:hypothetical protein